MLRDPKAIIYSDSDGVITDFYAQAEKVLGHKWVSDDSKKHEHGLILNQHEEFWESMPPMPDWKLYWGYIEKYSPHILTAVPSWDHNFSEVDEETRMVQKAYSFTSRITYPCRLQRRQTIVRCQWKHTKHTYRRPSKKY